MRNFKYISCSDSQVRWGGNDDPRGILVEGDVYELWDEYVHSSHTKLEFVDFPGLRFNSVCFEEVFDD